MKQAVAILVVLAIVGGIGWQVYRKMNTAKTGAGKTASPAVPVEIARVQRATIRDFTQPAGDLVAHSEFIVAPKVAGRVVKLLVDIGDTIHNNDVIAVLDDDEYKQQVDQAKAELEVAKASVDEARSTLETAQREFDRVEALRGQKIASESELDGSRSQFRTAQARHKVALAQVAQREASLRTAQVRQAYTEIRASWTGGGDTRMIGERFVNTGAMLAANDKIVSVVEIDELTGVIHVTEREYSRIHVDQPVDVFCDAYPGRTFAGKVVRVAPLVKQTSREARVEVQVDNHERFLRPGMYITAKIELARHDDAVVVPDAAIVRRNEKPAVFLVDAAGTKAVLVPVTAGFYDRESQRVEIVDPPLSGVVITMGQYQLEDGTPISIANREVLAAASRSSAASQSDEARARGEESASPVGARS